MAKAKNHGEAELLLTITLVYSPAARQSFEKTVQLPDGACAADALKACKNWLDWPVLPPDAALGVWGQPIQPGALLAMNDRLEIYRPLRVDPKIARRERFAKQGAGQAGLFANRRKGAKAGY